jgi:hypothetical protein
MWENVGEPDRPLFNPLSAELNPICLMLALLGAHLILHVSRIRGYYGHGLDMPDN